GMLDGISGGRLDVGFARAFLPHEFRRFGVSPDESVERFREGIEQVDLLLREENVTHRGRFHTIENTTSLPRPVQKPRPKFYVAALSTPESFAFAGSRGYSVMAIPMAGGKMRELLQTYRTAWREAGHSGDGEVMLAFHMFCDRDGERARRIAKGPMDRYLASLVDAASDWLEGLASDDYPNYDKVIAKLRESTMETQVREGGAWIGSPQEIRETIARLEEEFGTFEHASLQLNFNTLSYQDVRPSLQLFAEEVLPAFRPVATAP
ncbi:MAG: LLM class flavin-dependent oxidoreductase, partial [Candidatus Eremiobacteraeota bacterium]|nr:LLM class flavin-dependent oxidoreductase [Candidatus Eremiobacteraeota bacterium]